MRGLVIAFVLGATSAVALATPQSATATACGTFKYKHEVYVVGGKGLNCKLQRRWAERYVRRGIEPKGWKCNRGACSDRSSRAYFIWYRPVDRPPGATARESAASERAGNRLPTLTRPKAQRSARSSIRSKFEYFQYYSGKKVRCAKRISRIRRRCDVSWFAGDTSWTGHVTVWYRWRDGRVWWYTRGKVKRKSYSCGIDGCTTRTKTIKWGG